MQAGIMVFADAFGCASMPRMRVLGCAFKAIVCAAIACDRGLTYVFLGDFGLVCLQGGLCELDRIASLQPNFDGLTESQQEEKEEELS